MKIAALPICAAEGTNAALGRQLSAFICDTIRAGSGIEINSVGLMAQVEQDGVPRAEQVNISTSLLEFKFLEDLFKQSQAERAMDGLVTRTETGLDLTVRFHDNGNETPVAVESLSFPLEDLFSNLLNLLHFCAKNMGTELNLDSEAGTFDFGTKDPAAFLAFLEAFDALAYINAAQGRVVNTFDPVPHLDTLTEMVEKDPDWEAPYQTLIGLCRACANFRLGSLEAIEKVLKRIQELRPDSFEAFFALGEVYQGIGDAIRSIDEYEKSIAKQPTDPALYVRLGMVQMDANMPVNAERNFRKAMELEGDDKPSADFLANVLTQTNRAHEVPAIWKEIQEKNPQHAAARAKYAIALIQADKKDEAEKAFESALAELEEKAIVKRFYAPFLAEKGETDRAMDFYEDVLDETPNDIPVLVEYAQTLAKAEREFEIPPVLKTILGSNPDPNTRAQTLAWLTELEQPKRVESVRNAEIRIQNEDFEGAVRELRPMRSWLADYWKMWAMLAHAHNRLGQAVESEEAARKLLELFPGCEPGYGELTQSLNLQGRNEEAYSIMRIAAMNIPNSLPIGINLALAAKRSGREDEARGIARQIREAVGSNPELDQVLAEIES